MNWNAFAAILCAALLAWFGYSFIKGNTQMFTKENFTKTMGTLGLLALVLIAVVAFCVYMLKG